MTSFLPYYEKTGDWQALAWWIHDIIPAYSSMEFYPKLAALNITWHENPEKKIYSYVAPKGWLTKLGWANQNEDHAELYEAFIQSTSKS